MPTLAEHYCPRPRPCPARTRAEDDGAGDRLLPCVDPGHRAACFRLLTWPSRPASHRRSA